MQDLPAAFLIGKLSNRMRRTLAEMSSSSPYTGTQGKVLHYLIAGKEDAVYQKDIEQEFTLRPSSATELLKKMEENGLIYRIAEQHDARLKRIMITDKALEYAETVQKDMDEMERTLTRSIKPKDLEAFKKVCQKMLSNLEY